MDSAFHRLIKRLMGSALALCLGISLILIPFGQSAEAGRTSMSGDYLSDTLKVSTELQERIETSQSKEEKDDTVALITDYISRSRNHRRFAFARI